MAHPPRIPVWLRWEQEVIYFVRDRRKVLATNEAFAAFKAALPKLGKWTVIAGLSMPDHVHLLAVPKDRDEAIGNLTGALKRWMRQDLQADWEWQEGSFDRLLRSSESAQEKFDRQAERLPYNV
jgi:REP element-mobilizing transposase RayT